MSKDVVIYVKDTRDILAILTNTELNEDSEQILHNLVEIKEVDSTEDYILGDEISGQIKFNDPESNIVYLDDYRSK